MLILWLLWQHLLDKTYLKLYSLRICISLSKRTQRRSKFTRSWSSLAEWIIWSCFSRKVFCLMRRERQIRYGGKLLISGCLRSKSCTNVHFLDHTCSVSILKQYKELHKGICGSHIGVGHYPIGPLPRGIGGQVCRKKHRSM